MKIIKRNGSEVDFDINKIKNAITKANDRIKEKGKMQTLTDNQISEIADYIEYIAKKSKNVLTVEDIQDLVESQIMSKGAFSVAKTYIRYRYKRQLARTQYQELMDDVEKKIKATDVQNQNANVDENSFGGRMGEVTRLILKKFALENCMTEKSRNNHLNNEVYIHDLDSYAVGEHNCLSVPIDDLLANGFNTRQTDVRPAQSLSTAFQLVAVIFQLQSLQQFGGVSCTHLDWSMVPYVRKSFLKYYNQGLKYICEENDLTNVNKNNCIDISIENKEVYNNKKAYNYALELTEKETKQAAEGMFHNLNTLQSRSGNQLPFSSINYGSCTLEEGRMVTEAILEASLEGIGKLHKTPIFPCSIFQLGNGINKHKGDPNYDLYRLALKSTSLRLYPNYANLDWSGNEGYDKNDPKTFFSTMGCRTANGFDINGFGQLKDGRGNICPVTIILPTLAMEADRNVDKFKELLIQKISEAKDMLIERFDWICSQPVDAAKFMYENGTMKGYIPEEGIRSALKHGTLAIGQIALAETLQLLIGEDQTTESGMILAKEIEQIFKDKCAEYKEKYKLNFGVYYTPAENLCFTAMKKFQEKYGIISNVSDKEFFTNSIHVPVWKEMSPFEKIDIESQLTGYSSAGCITYIELDAAVKYNLMALETMVSYAMDKDIPYFAVNVPNDTCLNCGYTDEIGNFCPQCGCKEIQRLRRVTGYLTGNYTTAFNKGKQQEVEMRIKHKNFKDNKSFL